MKNCLPFLLGCAVTLLFWYVVMMPVKISDGSRKSLVDFIVQTDARLDQLERLEPKP